MGKKYTLKTTGMPETSIFQCVISSECTVYLHLQKKKIKNAVLLVPCKPSSK